MTISVALAWALLFGIYYLIPFTDRTGAQAVVRLVLGIAFFVGVLAWQLRQVTRAELAKVKKLIGKRYPSLAGADVDGDGVVTKKDLALVKANVGKRV